MSEEARSGLIFFEPWSLGDVLIAAAVARELSHPARIACHSGWHSILRSAFGEGAVPELLPIDLAYTTRNRASAFDDARIRGAVTLPQKADLVLSIRGDLRDFAVARRIFPGAKIKMNGWLRFLGRKNAFVNLPYALGLLPVQNRYRSWANLAGVPYQQLEQTYRRLQPRAPSNGRIVVHLGAQWRSKQFPDIVLLRDELNALGGEVVLLAGPGDRLPAGIKEKAVTRVVGPELVTQLRLAEHVITNDSGPMHLAAFLGCRTTAVVRTSPIEEWLPPATQIVRSAQTPRGYRPHSRYMTDEVLAGWPAVETVVAQLNATA